MKQTFIILLISAVFSGYTIASIAQVDNIKQHAPITDSLGYMKEIVANKQKYISQPLSVLLKDLKIPIKSYNLSTGSANRTKFIVISVSFDNSYTTALKMNKGYQYPVGIHIRWTTPLSSNDWEYQKSGLADHGEWTNAEQNYFSNKIIGDISPWAIDNAVKSDTIKENAVISDTVAYINAVVANKQKYINQPLSVLLKDLKVLVKSYSSQRTSENRFVNTAIWISFDDSYTRNLKLMKYQDYKDPLDIYVQWATPISREDVETHLKRAAGEWTAAEKRYYGDKLVSDILTWPTGE